MSQRIDAWQIGHSASKGFNRCFIHTPQSRLAPPLADSVSRYLLALSRPRVLGRVLVVVLLGLAEGPTPGCAAGLLSASGWRTNGLGFTTVRSGSITDGLSITKPVLGPHGNTPSGSVAIPRVRTGGISVDCRLHLWLSGCPRRMMWKWENRASAVAGQVSHARFTIPPNPVSGKP